VGLITFGTHVHVYELGFADLSKCYVFRGSKEYTSSQIADQLGIRPVQQPRGGTPAAQVGVGGWESMRLRVGMRVGMRVGVTP